MKTLQKSPMSMNVDAMTSAMKKAFALFMVIMLMLTADENWAESNSPANNVNDSNAMTPITITIGNTVFRARLHDNEAAGAFLKQMPVTLNMSDLNGNEKHYKLTNNLPSGSTEKPETIRAGELMCWSGNTLVLFYKTFSNAYGGYVRLGHIEDASILANALGSGDVEVLFAIDDGRHSHHD